MTAAVLTVDLDAVVANYRLLQGRLGGAHCSGVVKADAYGLGAAEVAPALVRAGCRLLFVAQLDEAVRLRAHVPEARIAVLEGLLPRSAEAYREHRVLPVLNELGQIDAWRSSGGGPAMLHVDTGMNRLGLAAGDVDRLAQDRALLGGVELVAIMSHLVSAEIVDDPLNPKQLARFRDALSRLPKTQASLANSSGIFLGAEYHFDFARPGAALYGIAPQMGRSNPMRTAVTLEAPILQVRDIEAGATVGYNAQYRAGRPTRIATVGLGYADGYLRSLTNRGHGYIAGRKVALAGRVSMDLVTIDVSDIPDALLHAGAMVEMIGPNLPPDDVAADAGTNAYEILTSLGPRYRRNYVGGNA
jgi:alanine racemase